MTTKERINETENRSIEIIQFKEHRKQLQKKKMNIVWGIILNGLTYIHPRKKGE